jgi:hypothetical protein
MLVRFPIGKFLPSAKMLTDTDHLQKHMRFLEDLF